MSKHFTAFRDKYLAAILGAVVILLSITTHAQKKYQSYPTPGEAKWWVADSALHIPAGPIPSLNNGLIRPGALYYVVTVGGDTALYSWTGSRWKKEGGDIDSTVQLRLGKTFLTVPVLVNPSTGEYADSLIRKGETKLLGNKYYLETAIDSFDAYPLTWQFLMDAVNQNGSGINKRNVLNGNGFMWQMDSMGVIIRQKVFTNGNDTAFALFYGSSSTPSFYVAQSKGVVSNTNLYVGSSNAIALNPTTGIALTDQRHLQLSVNTKIRFYQQPGILERTYYGMPNNNSTNYNTIITNDTVNGSVYPFPDSTKASILDLRYREHGGYESMKYRFMADGRLFRASIPNHTSVSIGDSLLTTQGGIDKRVRIADILALGGGGGGDVSSVFGRTGAVVATSGDYTWAQINKSTSSLADITTRNFSDLQSKPTTLSGYGITDAQPLDGDLTSIAAISANGIPRRTGANTWSIASAGTDYSPAINTTDHLLNLTTSTGAINMRKSITALTSGTSIAVDMDNGPNYSLSLAHNAAITISDEQAGDWFQLWVTQTSGNNTLTIDGQSIAIDPAASATTWIGGTWNGSAWIFSTNLAMGVAWTDITSKPTTLSGFGITDGQPLNSQLTALAAGSGTGIMRRTGASTYTYGTTVGLTTEVTGTLPYANGGTGLSSLGTANQLLRVNSGATALEYFTPSYITANQVHSEPTSRILLSNGSGGVVSDDGATLVAGLLSIGKVAYSGGALKLVGDQAGSVSLKVRSSSSQNSYDINLPLVAGAEGETMVTNSSGNMEWQAVTSGTWSPTLTNVNNVTSSSASAHLSYFRIGDRVFVSGAISVQPTTSGTTTTIRITLPISSAFDDASDCGGICGHNTGYVGTVTADISNDEAVLTFIPTATTNTSVPFTFSYIIK